MVSISFLIPCRVCGWKYWKRDPALVAHSFGGGWWCAFCLERCGVTEPVLVIPENFFELKPDPYRRVREIRNAQLAKMVAA